MKESIEVLIKEDGVLERRVITISPEEEGLFSAGDGSSPIQEAPL